MQLAQERWRTTRMRRACEGMLWSVGHPPCSCMHTLHLCGHPGHVHSTAPDGD